MLIVDTHSVVRGGLQAAGTMRIDCWMEGDLVCSRLEIGRDGYILGNVTARELFVEGQIVGQIKASVVHLMEGAFVEGDVKHSVMSIHPSASLLGKAVRTQGYAPEEIVAIEEKSSSERRRTDQESRANAKISGVDWSRYQARAS